MQPARKNSLCVVTVVIGVLLIGMALLVSIPHTVLATQSDIYVRRLLAVRLALLTSPDPDARHGADWLRGTAASLDRRLGEYLPLLSADD